MIQIAKYTQEGLKKKRDAFTDLNLGISLSFFRVSKSEIYLTESNNVSDLPDYWIEKPITSFKKIDIDEDSYIIELSMKVSQNEATEEGYSFCIYLDDGTPFIIGTPSNFFNKGISQNFYVQIEFSNADNENISFVEIPCENFAEINGSINESFKVSKAVDEADAVNLRQMTDAITLALTSTGETGTGETGTGETGTETLSEFTKVDTFDDNSCQAYYHFGGTDNSLTGKHYFSSGKMEAGYVDGKFGLARSLKGGVLNRRQTDAIDMTLWQGLTISSWIMFPDSSRAKTAVSPWNPSISGVFAMEYKTYTNPIISVVGICDLTNVALKVNQGITVTKRLEYDKWTHVLVSMDNELLQVFVEGELCDAIVVNSTLFEYLQSLNRFSIGYVGSIQYPGKCFIDQMKIFNRRITIEEVNELMEEGI